MSNSQFVSSSPNKDEELFSHQYSFFKRLVSRSCTNLMWLFYEKRRTCHSYIPVLCYHRVLPNFISNNSHVYSVTPEQFESHISFLINNGFKSLSLKEFSNIVKNRFSAPERSVLITFDDGYADNYAIALPIAKRYGIKITLFITTSFIGKPGPLLMSKESHLVFDHIQKFPELWRPLTWKEIKIMNNTSEVNFGIHGHTHQNLNRLSNKELQMEIDLSIEMFNKNVGYFPYACAIPYGLPSTFNKQILKLLNQSGIELIFSTITGRCKLPLKQFPLPRFVIQQNDDLETFKRKLFGAFDWIGLVRRNEQLMREIFM